MPTCMAASLVGFRPPTQRADAVGAGEQREPEAVVAQGPGADHLDLTVVAADPRIHTPAVVATEERRAVLARVLVDEDDPVGRTRLARGEHRPLAEDGELGRH